MNRAGSRRWTVGRDRSCDIVIDNEQIAPIHCEIVIDNGSAHVIPRTGVIATGETKGPWTKRSRSIEPEDRVRLADSIQLPWPDAEGARSVLTVGRAGDCDITLDHHAVSGRHADLIVGHRGTYVLRDTKSRNGLFVDSDLSQRVTAVMLVPGKSLFFGSQEFASDDLIEQIEQSLQSQPTTDRGIESAEVNAQQPPGRPSWRWVMAGIGPALLLALIWWSRSDVDGNIGPLSEEREPRSVLTQPDFGTLVESVASAESISDVDIEQDVAPPAEEMKSQAVSINDSLYWVLLHHDESNKEFRLGTAIATSETTVVTSGSIIHAMEKMLSEGFSDPTVVRLATGEIQTVLDQGVMKAFEKRSATARAIQEKHQKRFAGEARNASTDDDQDEIDKSDQLIELSLQAAAAVDVGWLRVSGVSQFIAMSTETQFRPAQTIRAVTAGFDREDPYFDAGQTAQIRSERWRIQGRGVSVDGIAGVLRILRPADDPLTPNLIGTPVVIGHQLAGLVVFQAGAVDNGREMIELVPAVTIAAMEIPTAEP